MMLGRVWGLQKKKQKPVRLMLMMLGRIGGAWAEACAADAHDAGLGLESSAKAGAADAHDAGQSLRVSPKAGAADARDAGPG